ncbi:hypothetical protein FY528_09050 [Hymenobacter lutimineralis]|uniref:Uncharacterized protein n=1 Tax=Hymenobacter lutimineralis TaxID=2606448 RepID=A0A5D6V6X4_9BACT|nr:hypothetical protein [Hymenobacter lutimineralis]TYZ10599.1 hypothetical protein FY528_09050 [Hymenobacter lutimineralis]
MTDGQRAWSVPYSKDAVLRFRNASTGYVRSYRVTTAENKMDGVSSRYQVCPQYYREYSWHLLERSDSTGNSENKELKFWVSTAGPTRVQATFAIGSTTVEVPLQEIEDETQILSPATFAGHTYPAVWGGTSSTLSSGSQVVVMLYLTKADGLIRFEERGGMVWERL